MSRRLVAVLSALVVFALGGVVSTQSVVAAESPDPCFGGVISGADDAGQLTGTDCTDVIVANERTTAIEAGEGDDVVIGAPNTVVVSGGIGWDYIVSNSLSAVVFGDSGNDIIDAGKPPAPGELGPDVEFQIDLAASVLPNDDEVAFRQAVKDELRKAHDAAQHPVEPNVELRQHAIDTNPLVQQVIGTPDTDVAQGDGDVTVDIEALHDELDAYARATSSRAEKLDLGARFDLPSVAPMDREWGNDPISGDGNDNVLYGGRGSDTIFGNGGNDLIYGGIEDDSLYGNDGNDYLLGGFGADDVRGGPGDDVVQGDATGDRASDMSGTDVLSFASGGADGFPSLDMSAYPNFPPVNSPERGIYVDLAAGVANNGSVVGGGGGNDPAPSGSDPGTIFSNFEHVVGTPFADYIVGNSAGNVLEGGGGSDVIKGNGGTDILVGDAGGDNLTAAAGSWLNGGPGEDYCGGSTIVADCEPKSSNWVGVRDTTKISVGMTTQAWAGHVKSQLYMAGSTTDWFTRNGEDQVTVQQVASGGGTPPTYYFNTPSSSTKGQFSTLPEDRTPGCTYTPTQVVCAPSTNVVTMVLAGFGSNDNISISNVFKMTNPIFLGGQGNDTLTGGNYTDDFMHDGTGADTLSAQAGDDGLVNTAGSDTLRGNEGDDLVESNSVCEGDDIGGGANVDSASWVQYQTSYTAGSTNGVLVNLSNGVIGKNVGGAADCGGEGAANTINGFEDLEGSRHWDILRGDSSSNQLIGRATGDQLRTYQSNDRVLANSADNDNIDCGLPAPPATGDIAVIDKPANGTDSTVDCESILKADPIFPDS